MRAENGHARVGIPQKPKHRYATMKTQIRPRARLAGFTLTEVLIVIVIIGALASLLFPLVSSMRRKADASTASSRLRQIRAAFEGYAADNNSRLPAAGGMPDVPGEANGTWVSRLQPYADGRPFTGFSPDELSECFVCPVWARTADYDNAPWNTGFAMNYRLARPEQPVSSLDTSTPRRQAVVAGDSARKILIAPNVGWGVQFQRYSKAYMNTGFRGARRYGNKDPDAPIAEQDGFGLYLFLDGHVRQLKPAELEPFFH